LLLLSSLNLVLVIFVPKIKDEAKEMNLSLWEDYSIFPAWLQDIVENREDN